MAHLLTSPSGTAMEHATAWDKHVSHVHEARVGARSEHQETVEVGDAGAVITWVRPQPPSRRRAAATEGRMSFRLASRGEAGAPRPRRPGPRPIALIAISTAVVPSGEPRHRVQGGLPGTRRGTPRCVAVGQVQDGGAPQGLLHRTHRGDACLLVGQLVLPLPRQNRPLCLPPFRRAAPARRAREDSAPRRRRCCRHPRPAARRRRAAHRHRARRA